MLDGDELKLRVLKFRKALLRWMLTPTVSCRNSASICLEQDEQDKDMANSYDVHQDI